MFDTGSTGFMLVCAMLVLLMTPGLAFFYGGLSRRKNVGNTMAMCFVTIGIVAITWCLVGWSFAYGGDGSCPFFGGFDQIGLTQLTQDMLSEEGDGSGYPGIIDVIFQAAFCMITTAIITGGVAGRMKFGAVCVFLAAWTVIVYPALAHMVWGGEGSLIGDNLGALDFAGGDVVHISSGLTALVLALVCGRRKGFGMMSYRAHNVPFVALGATLLWFGWFGFNAGSEFAADGTAGLALVNTVFASGAALVSWLVVERIRVGKPTLVGAATGLVAGLVVITPAAGFVEPWAAIIMGLIVSPICYFAISFCKAKFGYDDALDAFGCHCVGGVVGGILTGLFCVPQLAWESAASAGVIGAGGQWGGLFYTGDPALLLAQVEGIALTFVFVGILSLVLALIVKLIFKGSLRVADSDEAMGLDVSAHGESAYPAYVGLD
ncbi:MAG: ammonium transporter [Coriobacteriia bacterium]|nr:ammonium transporter [Coriobacteriia bacterium]